MAVGVALAAATALNFIGNIIGAVGKDKEIDEALAQSRQAIANAQHNAQITIVEINEQEREVVGTLRARAAGRGIETNVGSAKLLRAETHQRAGRAEGSVIQERDRFVAAERRRQKSLRKAKSLLPFTTALGIGGDIASLFGDSGGSGGGSGASLPPPLFGPLSGEVSSGGQKFGLDKTGKVRRRRI